MNPKLFIEVLKSKGITHYFGVPDSLLKPLMSNIYEDKDLTCVITANEGNAVAMAAGYHLATGKIAAIFMQNSGIGNAVNPFLSLSHAAVYNIPMVFIIGWRGEPGGPHDEPQHAAQGMLTLPLVECLGMYPQEITAEMTDDLVSTRVGQSITRHQHPAFIISKGAFGEEVHHIDKGYQDRSNKLLTREEMIEIILNTHPTAKIFATTGMIGREVYELRTKSGAPHDNDFLSVGSMGHVSSIAVGYAQEHRDHEVVILDGDGSFIMHMGASLQVAKAIKDGCRIFHYVLDNNCHASVGGGNTLSNDIDFGMLSRAVGYPSYISSIHGDSIRSAMHSGPGLYHVLVGSSARKDLGRPKESPITNKNLFMSHVND